LYNSATEPPGVPMTKRRRWLLWLLGVSAALAAALVANTVWVDSLTRPAVARDGGAIMATGIVPANVKVEGAGPAIVMIHGFGAAIDWWDDITPRLTARHRVIRLDLIGHGGTEAPTSGYAIERQAQLVSAMLDQLGVDRVTVIGHSMGGEVAVALAELKPERIERLILIDSPPTPGNTFTIVTEACFTPVIGELLTHFQTEDTLRRGLAQGFAPNFDVPERFVADLKQLTYDAFRTAHNESVAYRTSQPTYARLAALKPVPPLLAITGSLDAIVPPEHAKLFERVPGARVATIEGAGHSPMVEKPAKTLELIENFLK
jgi:pimeloyl-ACP methyl ester carboxylesterase